jgi:hyperosmotically inducible protein
MRALSQALVVGVLLTAVVTGVSPAAARSVGQVIDDTVITTEVKAKLTAEKLSNMTKVEVKTVDGIVTLNGTVDTPERRARSAQIAGAVDGVKGIVNNIHVAGSTVPAATAPTSVPMVDATGIVASVDAATGTVTLQDGRIVRMTNQTVLWQPTTIHSVRPGTQVLLRDATPVAVQPNAAVGTPEWRMGTVRSVDRGAGLIVLTDGTTVRLAPSAVVRRGNERIAVDQITPGSEIVIRTLPPSFGIGAEGNAFPGRLTVDASEVNVVWTPVGRR